MEISSLIYLIGAIITLIGMSIYCGTVYAETDIGVISIVLICSVLWPIVLGISVPVGLTIGLITLTRNIQKRRKQENE